MVNHSHVEEITPKDISPKNLIPTYSQYTAYSLKENKKKLKLKYQLTLQIIWIKVVHLYTIHQLHHKGSYIILLQQYKTIV